MRGRGILMSRANSLMLDALFLFTFLFVGGGVGLLVLLVGSGT